MRFTITFDLDDPEGEAYDDVYCWAHMTGGYRYYFRGDRWQRLPSTTLVADLRATDKKGALAEFDMAMRDTFSLTVVRASVAEGEPAAIDSEGVDSPPPYAAGKDAAQRALSKRILAAARRAVESGG